MENRKNAWDERFGWYWYSADAVFKWDDEKFEKDAKNFKDTGITSVILFGTHFRYSFWAYWDDIVKMIGRIVKIFHKHGIKVIEHHSSHLTYAPVKEEDWNKLLGREDGNSGDGLGGFPNFRETSQSNPILGGAHLDDFAQIDGGTGKKALSSYIHTEGKNMEWIFKHYNGNAHCFNHPAFEASYKDHLAKIIATGVDGMMNDDVQWFGGNNACTCEYCRQKFREETGYELPSPEDWPNFYENFDDPVYIAWKKFKKNSSADFHFRMDKFYKSLGFDPMRPAYCAEVLPFDTTCYGFEGGAQLWDYIFQECCGIIRESYVCFAGEAVHRYALARRHNVPSMALMYPSTKDSTYAGWALSRSWGQLFTGGTAKNPELYDKDYRVFEKANEDYYIAPDKISDIAFYFSKKTRDYCDHDAPRKFMKPLMSYVESAYVSGIGCDMVFEDDNLDALCRNKVIAAISVEAMEDAELLKLKEYVEQGGILYISGVFAEKDGNFQRRDLNTALKLLGMKSRCVRRMAISEVTVSYEGKTLNLKKADIHNVFNKPEGTPFAVTTRDGDCVGVIEPVGKGKVIIFSGETGDNPIQPAIWPKGEKTLADGSKIGEMKTENGAMLDLLVGKRITVQGAEDIIPTLYKVKKGMALHLVNTHDMLPETDTYVGRDETIPQFVDTDPSRTLLPELTVELKNVELGANVKACVSSPEMKEDRKIAVSATSEGYIFTIPAGLFSGYALIKIDF